MSIQLLEGTVWRQRLTRCPQLRNVGYCLLCATLLSACSDDGSTVIVERVDPVIVEQTPGTAGNPSQIAADGAASPLPAGTRAQTYAGNFDSGDAVFVLDDNNRLLGLVIDSDGTARSVRSDLSADNQFTGVFRQFTHRAKTSGTGFQLLPFAQSSESSVEAVVEIVDGQSISSLSSGLPVSLPVATTNELLPISPESVQGNWTGVYALCDSLEQNCAQFLMEFTISGNQIAGHSSMIAADGTDLLPSPVSGSLVQRGAVLDVSLRWNTYVYTGFAYVDAANTSQLMLVATTDSEIADERILASSLVRLR